MNDAGSVIVLGVSPTVGWVPVGSPSKHGAIYPRPQKSSDRGPEFIRETRIPRIEEVRKVETLPTIVTLLIALSVASERLVEIIKGVIPFLNQQNQNTTKEGWRRAAVQAMAVVAGIVTALLARSAITDVVPKAWQSTSGILALGLLASGGSGLWNAVLGYLLQVKDLKKLDVKARTKK